MVTKDKQWCTFNVLRLSTTPVMIGIKLPTNMPIRLPLQIPYVHHPLNLWLLGATCMVMHLNVLNYQPPALTPWTNSDAPSMLVRQPISTPCMHTPCMQPLPVPDWLKLPTTTNQITPARRPPAHAPPVQRPPVCRPPARAPPVHRSPAHATPVCTCPVHTHPARATPVHTPPARTTPVHRPPAHATPACTPPACTTLASSWLVKAPHHNQSGYPCVQTPCTHNPCACTPCTQTPCAHNPCALICNLIGWGSPPIIWLAECPHHSQSDHFLWKT